MSIVFHCNGGSRAFCAGFEESDDDTSYTIPDQDISGSPDSVTAVFDIFGDDSSVTLSATGEITMDLDWSDVDSSSIPSDCNGVYKYGVFEAGSSTLSSSAVGEDCDDTVGDFYDPTHQCPDFSGSEYCTDGDLCGDSGYTYSCDFDEDRYSCAPGDLSGKFGETTYGATEFSLSESGPGTLIPEMGALEDLIFALYCGDDDDDAPTFLACAPLNDAATTTPAPTVTPEDSGAFAQSLMMVAVTVAAMLF